MSYQLIERPHKQVFSGNPVRYVFQVSNPDTPGCAMEIALYIQGITNGSLPTLVTQQILTPNPDGKVYFHCEDYLNSQLDWQMPDIGNNNVQAVTSQIKKFYVDYRQITTGNQSPDWATDDSNLRTVLKGGVAKEKFDRNNFFINYLPTKQGFLTWLPNDHFVGLEERRYLTYFHFYDPEVLYVPVLRARVVYTDGTQDEVTKAFPSLDTTKLFHCPAGLKQLGLDNLQPAKQIWYYDVSVYNEDPLAGDTGDLAKPYRLFADYRKYYNVFSFTYHNSISGIDTLRIRGDWDIEVTINSTDVQQATGGDFSGQILPTENASVNISSFKTFDGDAGWMNTKQMQEALEDIILSDGVYRELFGRKWLRVVSLNKNQKMGSSVDTKWSFPIKWRYSYDNNYFTPFATDLGDGVMDEAPGALYNTCTAPENLGVELTDDEPASQTRRLSWDDVIDALDYELEYTGPDGIPHKVIVAATFYDLVLTVEGDYTWRVRTRCGDSDYSGFTQGTPFTVDFTAAACTSPAPLTVTLISIDGVNATVRFSYPAVAGVLGYFIEYREVGGTVWQQHFNPAGTLSVDKVVNKDVQYECRVRSSCNGIDTGPFVYGPNFIPSNLVGTCTPPSGLIGTAPFKSGGFFGKAYYLISLTWTTNPDASSYTIQIRIVGSPAWKTVDVLGPIYHESVPYKGNAGTEFEWRLRANCVSGGSTNFVNGNNFVL